MKPKLSQLLALAPIALAALAPIGARAAAVDYFLKIEGVEGESTDKAHSKEFVLDSVSFNVSNPASPAAGGGGGAGKATFSDISFVAKMSKNSPQLYLKSALGTHIPTATISVRKANTTFDFYTVKLSDVLITSVQTKGAAGDLPTETFSLNFTKVTWSYTPATVKGTSDTAISATWDIKTNKGG